MTDAFIYDAVRSPRGKGRPDGSLHEVTSVALSARLLNAVKARNHLEGRKWVAGEAVTIADLSCCGYLFYPEPFGFDRKDWSHIDAWLDRISALPRWKPPYELMPGSPADRV